MDNWCVGALITDRERRSARTKICSSVILCTKKNHVLATDRNRASVITGRWHIAWVMPRPCTDLWNRNLLTSENKLYDRYENKCKNEITSQVSVFWGPRNSLSTDGDNCATFLSTAAEDKLGKMAEEAQVVSDTFALHRQKSCKRNFSTTAIEPCHITLTAA